jgi:endonuclease YncB( thermonuclease family)
MLIVLLTLAAFLATSLPVSADDLAGQASVIDGDTLEIHGTRLRLWGMDAPESSQLCRGEDSLQYRCGAKAANDLDAFIAGRPVSCIPISLDQYGRTVATCSVGGVDLGEWLVRNGLALDWPQYSKGKFDPIQREAEHAGRGMCGQAAMSSPGYFGFASAPVVGRPNVRTTRMPILEAETCAIFIR